MDGSILHASARGTAITVSGLTKAFGVNRVLRGVDLHIRPGEFVSVVGRSGCGKSTLLRILAGLDAADGGTLAFDGDASVHPSAVARLMYQESRLLPWARVLANVEVGLGTARGPERRDLAHHKLAEVGLGGREGDWPTVLSGGQRQRVALARALVSRPRFLALDEPLGALDALTRIEMQRLVERVWQEEGFTALLVTHDVTEAIILGDRVVLIEDGVIALELAVDLPRPRHRGTPEVAALEAQVLGQLFRDDHAA
ncbi:ATP-binding cassette domain-containing protein [Falsiroseomonas sp. HW251]|uniref:ATP-binding cassette domain-containing protein n=1 Tax=Falsiroseomonas sp. HW251 TaxID=3390998 RepID=UPI003D313FB7